MSILDKIKVIIDKLSQEEPAQMKRYYSSKLIYPMGYLRNLSDCLEHTFMQEQIPHQAKLVFVG